MGNVKFGEDMLCVRASNTSEATTGQAGSRGKNQGNDIGENYALSGVLREVARG